MSILRSDSNENTDNAATSSLGHDPRQMELPLQDGDGTQDGDSVQQESQQTKQTDTTGLDGQGFFVTHVEDHEDGSATFSVRASEKDMRSLFEAFFKCALTKGIEHAEQNTNRWIAERNALRHAQRLVNYLDIWEECDDFDYSPSVAAVKSELKVALKLAEKESNTHGKG